MWISLFSLICISCSSTDKDKSVEVPIYREEFPELENINNEDFVPPRMVVYHPYRDHFAEDPGLEKDSLSRESLNRASPESLDRFQSSKDPIESLISECYKFHFDEAFKIADNAYAKYKKHPSYWNQIGTCYLLKREYRKALLFYNKALDLNPNYAPPINNLGLLFLRQGQDQKALIAFKKASELNTFSRTPKFNLAQLFLEYGLLDESLKLFTVLYELNRADVGVLTGLANCYLFLGNIPKSLSYFNLIAPTHYFRPDVSLNYAVALRLNGNNEKSKYVYDAIDKNELKELSSYYITVGKFLGGT